MKNKDILSYVYDFLSLLFEKEEINDINQIILFGSVTKNEFDNGSDIDLFFDVKKNKKGVKTKIESALNSFHTKLEHFWKLKGITLPIKPLVDDLDLEEWKELKQEIISNGIKLYGEYKELPNGLNHYYLFEYSLKNKKRKDKMKLLRGLYGYESIKGKKVYKQKGLLDENGGIRLGTYSFLIPQRFVQRIKDFLESLKVSATIREVWIKE